MKPTERKREILEKIDAAYLAIKERLERNGWRTDFDLEEECGYAYSMTFHSGNFSGNALRCKIIMSDEVAFENYDSLGIINIIVTDLEERTTGSGKETSLSVSDIDDIYETVVMAEENLLLIGIPFMSGYVFHGSNKAEKNERNSELREKYDLNNLEVLLREI